AGRDTLARERLGDAQRESERCLVRQRDAALEGGEEARRNAVERDGQRTNAEQRPAAVAPGRTHEQPRPAPHAQSAGEPALGALGESLRGAARGPLGILRLEAEHPVGLVTRHQSRPPFPMVPGTRRGPSLPGTISGKSVKISPFTVSARTSAERLGGKSSVMPPFTVRNSTPSVQLAFPIAATIDPFTVVASA